MMKMKSFNIIPRWKYGAIVIAAFVISSLNMSIKAQFISCGTILSQEQIDWENSFSPASHVMTEESKTLSIAVQVIKNKAGEPGITETAIYAAVETLNENFTAAYLQFSVCKINYIENYQYNNLTNQNEPELTSKYLEPKLINLFIVEQLADFAGNPVCAYTYYPSENKNYLFIAKDCFEPVNLTHQMGHFFGLYHTHETAFGQEHPDGKNCETTGDLICDTPADPMLAGKVNDACTYTANTKLGSEYYSPVVTNYMSFSRPSCMCEITRQQAKRIQAVLYNYKIQLW